MATVPDGIRRKRDDQAFSKDASAMNTDTTIPRRQKRRRTNQNLVDQLQNIRIAPTRIYRHAGSGTNLGMFSHQHTMTSGANSFGTADDPFLGAADRPKDAISSGWTEDQDISNEDNGDFLDSDDEEEDATKLLLSDAEEAQRVVMRELVFGAPGAASTSAAPRAVNPVDRKLQALLRQSLRNVARGGLPHQGTDTSKPYTALDDAAIDPVYARTATSPSAPIDTTSAQAPTRSRSNSLPEDWGCQPEERMDEDKYQQGSSNSASASAGTGGGLSSMEWT